MHSITNLLLILGILVLSGCAAQPPTEVPDPVILTKYVQAECGTPPSKTAVNLRSLSWQIIEGRFTLSPEGYEDLSYNVSMILAGIKELQSEIEFYEACVASSSE